MDYDAEIRSLSHNFYSAYPMTHYPELMRKEGRPYTCLIIDTCDDYLICIPFRSSISHNEAFLFNGTNRAKRTRSGLDYKKMVLVQNLSYIADSPAVVDSDEYAMVIKNFKRIARESNAYIDDYVKHMTGLAPLHHREFSRKYHFSTLPYFHDILKLPV